MNSTIPRPVHTTWVGAAAPARGLRCSAPVGQSEVQAVDHHQAEAVEQHRDRQQQRVGVRRHPADDQVGDEADDERSPRRR